MSEIEAKIVIQGVDKASPAIKAVHRTLLQAAKDIQSKNLGVTESFKKLSVSLRNLTLAAIGVGGGIFAIVKSTANAGDRFLETAQKVGVTVEGLQRLAYAADLSGVSQDGLATSLKFLNKNLVEARGGSKDLGAAFKILKLDPKKLGNTEEAFVKIGGAIGGMRDQQKKTAVALQIFGRAGSDLIPLFNEGEESIRAMGKELEDMGGIIGTDLAKRSDEFNDNLTKMTFWLGSLKTLIGVELLPIFSDAAKGVLAWFAANKELVRSRIKEFAEGLIKVIKVLWGWLSKIVPVIGRFIDRMGGIERVAKIAAEAIAFIYALKILKGFTDLTVAVISVSSALKGIKMAALGANAALLSIGAIIGSIWLVTHRKEGTAAFKALGLGFLVDGSIVKAVVSLGAQIGDTFSAVWSSATTGALNFLAATSGIMPGKFMEALGSIKEAFVSTFNAIRDFVGGVISQIGANLRAALSPTQAVVGAVSSAFGMGQSGGSGTFETMKAAASTPQSSGPSFANISGRLQSLAQEISGQQSTLRKPQTIDMRIKVDSPVPTQVTNVSSTAGLSVKPNTGQMMP